MYRPPNDKKPPEIRRVIRPAGDSDEYSDSSDDDYGGDGFDMPGLSKTKKRNCSLIVPNPQPPPSVGNEFEDWGTGKEAQSSTNSTPHKYSASTSYSQRQEPISGAEAARIACSRGQVDKVKEFLDKGVIKANCFFTDSYTPLITASAAAYPNVVKLLLEQGADPKTFSHSNGLKTTALMAAASATRPGVTEDEVLETVGLLLEGGCPINTQDASSISALVIAIKRRNDRRKVAELLLDRGADPNVQDFSGRTPLFHAAEVGDGRSCRLLLEKGGDINHIDDAGWSAFDVANDKGFHDLSELLYKVKNTKWIPGASPLLMKEIEDHVFKPKEDSGTIREDSQIEMLLSAINGGKYTDNFRQHKVTYLQFLQFDEQDLKDVGVDEVGIRKKLLDSIRDVHNTDWNKNSLRMVPVNKKVTAAETVCIINNIKSHVEHISTTLSCLRKRIYKDPQNLRFGKEKNKIKDIISYLGQLDKNNLTLGKEVLKTLKMFDKLKDNAELKLADCFELEPNDLEDFLARWDANMKKNNTGGITKKKWFLVVGGAIIVAGIALTYNSSFLR